MHLTRLTLFSFFIEAQLIYSVLFQMQSKSNLVIHMYILLQIIFHYRLIHYMKCSPLCYTVGPCCLFILCIVVCVCQSLILNLSLPLFALVTNCKFVFYANQTNAINYIIDFIQISPVLHVCMCVVFYEILSCLFSFLLTFKLNFFISRYFQIHI